MTRTIVFDLDGTLCDTSGDLLDAANACFRALGQGAPLAHGADDGVALRGGRAMLRLGFERLAGSVDEAAVDREYPNLLRFYADQIDHHTRFFPGAMEAVERVRARGDRVAVCTNKPEALAELLLTRLGVRKAFGALIGADTLATRKPDPAPLVESVLRAGGAPERSVLIGDTITDLDTARAAGRPVVLVTFGPSGAVARGLAADGYLAHFDALEAVVDPLLG